MQAAPEAVTLGLTGRAARPVYCRVLVGVVVQALYCEEADHTASGGRFRDRAFRIVEAALREQRQEASKLYNPYRNLYLDKRYGESKTPLGEWMYFPTNEED